MPYLDEACPYCGAREGERHHKPECNRAIAAAMTADVSQSGGSIDPTDLVNVTMERDMLRAQLSDLKAAASEVVDADAEYDRTLDVGYTQSATIEAFNAVWASIERLRKVLDA